MSCDAFLEWIKSDFDYLFADYGFKVIYTDAAVTREDHCLVILESPQCRVKFYRTYEEANVTFGALSAPLTWADKEGDAEVWFYIREILDFVNHVEPDLEYLLAQVGSRPVGVQLRDYAEKLRPVCAQVVSLFQGQDSELRFTEFIQWQQDSTQRLREEMRRKYSPDGK